MDNKKSKKFSIKKKILICGGNGLLGNSLAEFLQKDYKIIIAINKNKSSKNKFIKKKLNFRNFNILEKQIKFLNPNIILNCIGLSNVDECEKNKKKAILSNKKIPIILSRICKKNSISYYHISTDHVYDGKSSYSKESKKTTPVNFYAKSKLDAEVEILKINKKALIIRTNFFCNSKSPNFSFSDKIIKSLKSNKKVELFRDVYFSPIYTKDLAKVLKEIFKIKNLNGIYNIGCNDRLSKYEFGIKIAEEFNFDKSLVTPGLLKEAKIIKRPFDMSLDISRIQKKLSFKINRINKMIKNLHKDYINLSTKYLPYGKHNVSSKDISSVASTLRSGHLTQGPKVVELENRIANYLKCKYVVAVSSCTAGMHIAIEALNLKKNKKILLPPITFVSTANAVLMNNLKPEFIDINASDANIDIKKTIDFIKKNQNSVAGIMPVHFGGYPCDIKKFSSIRKKGIKIIEDGAHALGARYNCGSMVGSCKYSDLCVFSLHPVKTLAAGEGGIITTNNYLLYKKLLRLRSHGINKSDDKFILRKKAYTQNKVNGWYYEMQSFGYNYRITDIQCSLAISQLKRINLFLKKRRFIASKYIKYFKKNPIVEPLISKSLSRSSNHLFIIKIPFKKIGLSRQYLMSELKKRGIISQVHYIPVNMHPYYKKLGYKETSTPEALNYYNSALSIPVFFDLTISQQKKIILTIQKILKKNYE